jgi:hypothetical protein
VKIFNWIDKSFFTIIAVAVGISFLYFKITSPRLKTATDFLHIDGKVSYYSFENVPGHRSTLHQYYIWLDNYNCTFQIKADFLPNFDHLNFENEIRKGDVLKIIVPKEHDYKLPNKNETICVLSITKNATNYLSLIETIPKENDSFDIYVGVLFIASGLIYYGLKRLNIVK